MIPAALAGVWAATQAPPAVSNQWIQPANGDWQRFAVPATPIDETMHYFLVVTRGADGALHAFVRNPERNVGVFLGSRTMLVDGAKLTLRAAGKPDVSGSVSGDTLTVEAPTVFGSALAFHRPFARELQWYYPRETEGWTYRQPVPAADGWDVGTLAGAGMREAPIAALMRGIVSRRSPDLKSPYVQSIAIARHGRLVLDEYFYGFTAATAHDVRSAGKSVTTLIVGRAIEDTHAFAPATTVLSLLPQYSPVANDDRRKQSMTVADLMTMSSGLACDDNDDSSPGNEDAMQSQTQQPDWYKYTLDLPMRYDPGTRAVYCSAGINLLGAIVLRATAQPLEQYFYDRFAAPMQFGAYGLWLMPPPTNAAYMGGGDYFRPRDFMKFGELFLRGGRWNGRQIVSAGWLRQSATEHAVMHEDPSGPGDRYGFGWHLPALTVAGRSYDVINAGGNGGQLLAVVPQLDLVVMVTAGNYNQYPVWSRFLQEIVGTAIRSVR